MPKLSTATQTSSLPSATTASSSGTTVAITTTFTPAATCNPSHLTQLSSPGYFIWVAEPIPVPSITATDCYPSEWIQNYATAGSSSVAPFVDSLVCPLGWSSAFGAGGGYMACCPESYQLEPPSTLADPRRPAYGGTCYSNIASGSTIQVTAYDSVSVTTTAEWSATTDGGRIYAHPIDGISYQEAIQMVTLSQTASVTPISTAFTDRDRQPATSKGTIAGIAVGAVVGAVLLAGLLIFFWRRARRLSARRSRYALEADSDNVIRWVSEMSSEKSSSGAHDEFARKAEMDGYTTTTISELESLSSDKGSLSERH